MTVEAQLQQLISQNDALAAGIADLAAAVKGLSIPAADPAPPVDLTPITNALTDIASGVKDIQAQLETPAPVTAA